VKRVNKYIYLYIVQGNYGYGWDDEAASENEREAINDLRAYRRNGPGSYRMIRRREPNPEYKGDNKSSGNKRSMTPKQVIKAEYGNSKNFMTPHVLDTGWCGKLRAFELSTGEGFGGTPIYGVSVVQLHADGSTERCYDLSQVFATARVARQYIADLSAE
jgi:hypothetical protein